MRIVVSGTCAGVFALLASAGAAVAQSKPQFGIAGVTVEGVVLQRHELGNFALTIPSVAGTYGAVNYSEMDTDLAGGLRLKFDGWFFGTRTVYSVLGAWGFDGNLLRTDLDVPGNNTNAAYVPGADVGTADSSNIFAVDAKLKGSLLTTDSAGYFFGGSPDRPGFKFIAGTRTVLLDEKLSTVVYDTSLASTDNDHTKVKVANFATGLQLGIEGYAPIAPGWTLGGFIKGGLLANFVDVESSFVSQNNAANQLSKSYDSVEFAQFVELSARLTYQLAPNVALTASGMLLYVNGIAEAGGQFSSVADNDARSVKADSDALYYGGTLGLSIKLN